jgi:hypothetical protein
LLALEKLFLVLAHLDYVLVFLELDFLPFMFYYRGKQLFFETLEGDCKIDDIDSNEDLRKEVGVGNFGEHKNGEILIVIEYFIGKFDHRHVIDYFDFSREDGIEDSWQCILYIED